jgi:putative aminopeptidase FrvX
MRPESLQFLKDLMLAPSPSGFEQPAQRVIRSYAEKFADEVRTDLHGNLMAIKNPDAQPRVMLAGHCDQIGLMVRYIDDDGFVYFAPIGGIDANILAGQFMVVHTKSGPVKGVVGRKAIHLMDQEERNKAPKMDELWLDIGAKDKKSAQRLVSIGDPITFDLTFHELQGDLVASQGFDDKMGSFVVMEALRLVSRRKLQCAVFAVSTVQEEIGLRGARTSAFGIDPLVGIAVDVTHASDYPEAKKKRTGDIKIGGGPVISRGPNMNPMVTQMLVAVAQEQKIPYQMSGEPAATGTDANPIQVSRAGVAAGLVSVPNRYMHTPVEVLALGDLENAARLIAGFLLKVTPQTDFTPR